MNDDADRWELAWNVLATAQEGAARDLKRLLRRHGSFRPSGFRNVMVGQVADHQEFFRALAAELEQKPFAVRYLGKVLPITVSFPVRVDTFCSDVESRLAELVGDLVGKSFHVRVERRGHKGLLQTQDLERRFGDFLWQCLEQHQAKPVVVFRDPDVIVGIEIVGVSAGIAMVGRELRQRFAFVKID